MNPYPLHMNPLEWHHWYLGMILKLIGLIMIYLGQFWWGLLVHTIGQLIKDDDQYQHTRQLADPDYHSPLHFVFGKYLYKYRAVRWLTQTLDRLVGKLRRGN